MSNSFWKYRTWTQECLLWLGSIVFAVGFSLLGGFTYFEGMVMIMLMRILLEVQFKEATP